MTIKQLATLLFLSSVKQEKFDPSKMHQKGTRESQTLVDDGTGRLEIWRIEDFELAAQERALYGQFFGGDSYVILYTYLVNGKECYIIYFWQGQVRSLWAGTGTISLGKDRYDLSGLWQGQVRSLWAGTGTISLGKDRYDLSGLWQGQVRSLWARTGTISLVSGKDRYDLSGLWQGQVRSLWSLAVCDNRLQVHLLCAWNIYV